jgi:hypothetical protein
LRQHLIALRTISSESRSEAVFFCCGCADAPGMIGLAVGIIACLFGIIALLPDADGFSDE